MIYEFGFKGTITTDSDSPEVAETLIEEALSAVPGVDVTIEDNYVGELDDSGEYKYR